MALHGNTPVFNYSEDDVLSALSKKTEATEDNHSEFDHVLCSHWDTAMSRGIFRYDLGGITTRIIPGRYGFVAQKNPKRFSHRRRPMDALSLTQPFNPELFNFNKIKKEEILFEVQKSGDGDCDTVREEGGVADDKRYHNVIVINVSPIDYGHVLLVPKPGRCLPQVMTEDSIQLCLELVALSGHRGLCMVGNSLLAYASVNHLHYHFMYIAQPLLAARVKGRPLTGCCFELVDHPSYGFGFELRTSPTECAREIYKVISLLLQSNIPHNIVMLRGEPFHQDENDTTVKNNIVRTLLIPRRPAYGLKNVYENEHTIPPFFAAACELALGFIPVVDQSKFATLTEDEVLQILGEKALSSDEFHTLKTRAKHLLDSKS